MHTLQSRHKSFGWLEETLPDVVVTGSLYTTCEECLMTVERRNLKLHLEQDCPMRSVECWICHDTYIYYKGHECEGICLFCKKPSNQCNCPGYVCNGNNQSGNTQGGGNGSNDTGPSSGSSGGTTSSNEKYIKATKDVFALLNEKYPKTPVCNFGVQEMSKRLFGRVLPELNGKANEIYNNLENSSKWHKISYTNANEYVNQGYFVIAVWNSGNSGSGHVNTILPGHTGNTWSDIYVMDTGWAPWSNEYGQSGNSRSENHNIKKSFGEKKRYGSIGSFGIYYYK